MVKILVIIILLMIVASLFQGMYYLTRDDGDKNTERLVRALTIRVALSLLLFAFLMISYLASWIDPVSS